MEERQYYSNNLSAERLKRCYDIAPPRTRQYLEAEIEYVLNHISPTCQVIELGCGYGRILARILEVSEFVTGIDTSFDNLAMAKSTLSSDVHLLQMDAGSLGLLDNQFDVVLCLQNGLSAFKVEPAKLVKECIRVARPSGICLFSSYSPKFWDARMEWFQLQSDEGLIGEIDSTLTRDGVIVCKDGFKSTAFGVEDFTILSERIGVTSNITEIDASSIFWEILIET